MWSQTYDPLNNAVLSTLAAAIPVAVMLAALAFFHIKAHIAALLGLLAALGVAIFAYAMPANTAVSAALLGAANGLLPIGWIILNVIFLYSACASLTPLVTTPLSRGKWQQECCSWPTPLCIFKWP